MHFNIIIFISPFTPPRSSHFPTQFHDLFFVVSVVNYLLIPVCPVYSWMRGHQPECGWPTRNYILKKPYRPSVCAPFRIPHHVSHLKSSSLLCLAPNHRSNPKLLSRYLMRYNLALSKNLLIKNDLNMYIKRQLFSMLFPPFI